jgi:hypothetical protein|nr:MAG TPA: hypothetical protein [Caudoviricetes sp.]
MVTVIRQTKRNNAIVAISEKNPEKAQVAVMEVRVEYVINENTGSTFEQEHKRVAYLNIDTINSANYYEGKELPGQVNTWTSHTPFYEGQEPKMKQDEKGKWTIPYLDAEGKMVYTRNVYDASGKLEDKFVDAAQLRALADASKANSVASKVVPNKEPQIF